MKRDTVKLGFTMIEVIVVITLISVLFTVGVLNFSSSAIPDRQLRQEAEMILDNLEIVKAIAIARQIDPLLTNCKAITGSRVILFSDYLERRLDCVTSLPISGSPSPTVTQTLLPNSKISFKYSKISAGLSGNPPQRPLNFSTTNLQNPSFSITLKHVTASRCVDIATSLNGSFPKVGNPRSC